MTPGPLLLAAALAAGGPPPSSGLPPPNQEARWGGAATAAVLNKLLGPFPDSGRRPEAVEMIEGMLSGKMGPGQAWFHDSENRFSWKWLAQRCDTDDDGAITPAEFGGSRADFAQLDRDGDGSLTAVDFDWSPRSPLAKQDAMAYSWFQRTDENIDGRISRAEWDRLFNRAAAGRDHLTPEDVRKILFPPAPPRVASKGGGMPSPVLLLKALFQGELGSPFEGPRVGEPAPQFVLPSYEGDRVIALKELIGKKPVVLVFGSFT